MSDNRLARDLLGWEPQVTFDEGVQRTVRWFYENHDRDEMRADFERKLTER